MLERLIERTIVGACAGAVVVASVHAATPLRDEPHRGTAAQSQVVSRGKPDAHTARADAIFARWNRRDAPGCSAAVERRGTVVYSRGFGMANLEHGRPITPASVFHVASVSKQFTAFSVLLLAEQGKLSLDDEVRRYVPEWSDVSDRVTIRHLLNHTSGLRDVFLLTEMAAPGDRGLGTAGWLVSLLARQRSLNFPPGQEFQYNNGGYLLLADIVARVSGQPLPAFAKAHIFDPLGMTQTFFHDDASVIVPNRATGYIRRDGTLRIAIGFDSLVGNGGLFTTPRDLLRWERNFVEPRVGTAATLRSMEAATTLADGRTSPYGFGLQIVEYRGRRAFGHGGGDQGASAYTVRFPDNDLSVAIACNSDEIDSLTPALDLADVFLGKSAAAVTATAPAAVNLSPAQLARNEGLYRDPAAHSLLRMFVRDGTLVGSPGAGTDGGWATTALSETRFAIPYTPIVLEFEHEGAGRARTLRVVGEKPQPVTLERLDDAFRATAADLEAVVGEYASDELDVVYTISLRDGSLVLQIPGRKAIPLQPIVRDGFLASYLGVLIVTRDPAGEVTGFTSHTSGVSRIRFERTAAAARR